MPRFLVRSMLFTLLAAIALVPLACGDDDPTDPGEDVFVIRLTEDNTFSPANPTIDVGTTVRWVNDIERGHTITPRDDSQPGVWTSQNITDEGQTFEWTFDEAGETYDYFCIPHEDEGMEGTITVQ